jgi:hypothetical protein
MKKRSVSDIAVETVAYIVIAVFAVSWTVELIGKIL